MDCRAVISVSAGRLVEVVKAVAPIEGHDELASHRVDTRVLSSDQSLEFSCFLPAAKPNSSLEDNAVLSVDRQDVVSACFDLFPVAEARCALGLADYPGTNAPVRE